MFLKFSVVNYTLGYMKILIAVSVGLFLLSYNTVYHISPRDF